MSSYSGSSSGPESEKVIGADSIVTMHYSLALSDGTIVENSYDNNEPLTFTMGDGTLIAGLEIAVLGLKAGDQQSLSIDPDVAFGYPDENAIQTIKREEFADELSLRPGLVIEFETPSGLQVPGTIKEVKEDDVVVDFSHPLAGHTVIFNVKILDVQ